EQDVCMLLLEDKHWPQAHCTLTGSTNIDTEALRPLEELIASGVVEGDEGAHALSSQVLEFARIFLRQRLQFTEEVTTDASSIVDKIQLFDLLDNSLEEERTSRVTHPRIKLSIRLVRSQLEVAVVVASRLRLLREGNHVRRISEVPVLVCPEFT